MQHNYYINFKHVNILSLQEARRAAGKAYDVPRVDDRVNKAVAAANQSANAARVAAVKAVQKRVPNNGDDFPTPIVWLKQFSLLCNSIRHLL